MLQGGSQDVEVEFRSVHFPFGERRVVFVVENVGGGSDEDDFAAEKGAPAVVGLPEPGAQNVANGVHRITTSGRGAEAEARWLKGLGEGVGASKFSENTGGDGFENGPFVDNKARLGGGLTELDAPHHPVVV